MRAVESSERSERACVSDAQMNPDEDHMCCVKRVLLAALLEAAAAHVHNHALGLACRGAGAHGSRGRVCRNGSTVPAISIEQGREARALCAPTPG